MKLNKRKHPLYFCNILVVILLCFDYSSSVAQKSKEVPEMPPQVYNKLVPVMARIVCNNGNNVGSGSIVALSPERNAYILTACHVVAKNFSEAKRDQFLSMKFFNDIKISIGEETKLTKAIAVKTCFDKENDLVLLATAPINSNNVIRYNKSDGIKPGKKVAAFGYPETEKPIQTVGIIDQKPAKYFVMKTKLTKGNSGGPLVDKYGRMIGMALFIKGRSKGYALQMNLILPIVDSWLKQLGEKRYKSGKYIAKKWKRQKYGKFWHRFFIDPKFVIPELGVIGYIIYKIVNPPEPDLPGPPGFPEN